MVLRSDFLIELCVYPVLAYLHLLVITLLIVMQNIKISIHCSAAIITAYLMKCEQLPLEGLELSFYCCLKCMHMPFY